MTSGNKDKSNDKGGLILPVEERLSALEQKPTVSKEELDAVQKSLMDVIKEDAAKNKKRDNWQFVLIGVSILAGVGSLFKIGYDLLAPQERLEFMLAEPVYGVAGRAKGLHDSFLANEIYFRFSLINDGNRPLSIHDIQPKSLLDDENVEAIMASAIAVGESKRLQTKCFVIGDNGSVEFPPDEDYKITVQTARKPYYWNLDIEPHIVSQLSTVFMFNNDVFSTAIADFHKTIPCQGRNLLHP